MSHTSKTERHTFDQRLSHMIHTLRLQILQGIYAPGSYLPAEKKLAEQFDLSNKSVRKGLDSLVQEGFIQKVDRVGSQVVHPKKRSTISISFGYHTSMEQNINISSLLDDFHQLYPSVHVTRVPLPVESVQAYMSTVKEYMENGLIDLATINNLDFQYCTENGWTSLLEPVRFDNDMYRFAQDAFRFSDNFFVKPIIFSPIVLAYNKRHFKECAVQEPDGSWTWEDAMAAAATLTNPAEQRYGIYFHFLSDNRWPAFLLQSDVCFDQDGMLKLKHTRTMDAIQLCKQMITDHTIFPDYLTENNRDVTNLFIQNKASMILTTYMMLNDLKQATTEYDISPLPYMDQPKTLATVIGVTTYKASNQKEAAILLADYLTSGRAQQIIRKNTLSIPALKTIAESPQSTNDTAIIPSRYSLFRETLGTYGLHQELNLSIPSFMKLRQLLKSYFSNVIDENTLCIEAAQIPHRNMETKNSCFS